MMSWMKFKLILFDAGDVIFQSNTAISDSLAKKFNISEEELVGVWKGVYKDLSRGTHTTDEFIDLFANKFNIPRDQINLDDFIVPYKETLVLIPGIEDLITKLSKKNITLASLSDTSEMFHLSRNNLRIFKYFDKQFLSFDIGHMKPDKKTFQTVIDHYKLKPEEIFFIDDNQINIDAAKGLGMNGVIFKNTKQLTKALQDNNIL